MTEQKKQAKIRRASTDDIARMMEIHDICFKPPMPQDLKWWESDIEFVISNFPQGQLIAQVEDSVAGHIISGRVSEEHYKSHPPLMEIVGIDPPWGHFDAEGNTMWILEIAVDPAFKRCGAARALVQTCKRVATETEELVRFGAGARIPGYAKWQEQTGKAPEEYCQEVIEGRIFDPVLGPFLKFGTRLDCVVSDYVPDPESLNFGAAVIWERDMA